ncbi:alanine racemase [Photobacterium jeanii]|uniref:Alanine racemase n=1 Tax=Photobacterium jeanii TaxID=858640 RepID=A0A178KA04_9GAMM|nr:alanine/ornithine racemase family PLP-dependent enzyme [Photobacterium jeanii]OAN13947.1 alanine racemase [Photobacterium jeanii]
MPYPTLSIDLDVIESNTRNMVAACQAHGVKPVGVTKLLLGSPEVAQAMIDGGIEILGDARLMNLARYQDLAAEKMLIRLPSFSEVDKVIALTDISLNSESSVLCALSEAAVKANKIHRVVLMHDLGDLREGCFDESETLWLAELVQSLPNLELIGVGSNLACYGGVAPSAENQNQLVAIAEKIESKFGLKLSVISGASSAGLDLMLAGEMPSQVNQLRLGASLIMGIGLNDEPVPTTQQNAIHLEAELIEIKQKPSVPVNSTALDAFGNTPEFIDKGIRCRGLCAIGRQDVELEQLIPTDSHISVVGGSSDHLIVDLTDCSHEYHVGDRLTFDLGYGGVLQCATSEFVHKAYVRAKA